MFFSHSLKSSYTNTNLYDIVPLNKSRQLNCFINDINMFSQYVVIACENGYLHLMSEKLEILKTVSFSLTPEVGDPFSMKKVTFIAKLVCSVVLSFRCSLREKENHI